jgi:hypothetical protein
VIKKVCFRSTASFFVLASIQLAIKIAGLGQGKNNEVATMN